MVDGKLESAVFAEAYRNGVERKIGMNIWKLLLQHVTNALRLSVPDQLAPFSGNAHVSPHGIMDTSYPYYLLLSVDKYSVLIAQSKYNSLSDRHCHAHTAHLASSCICSEAACLT